MEKKPDAAPLKVDFSTFVLSLATGAMIHLGIVPDPTTGKTHPEPELARQNIEILSLLHEKTKGNLTSEEASLIENILTEVRLRYVDVNKPKT